MNANREVAAKLFDACVTAGIDPEAAFMHMDDKDVAMYGRALESGGLLADHLPLFMRSLDESITSGRCLCAGCCEGVRP